MKMAYRYLDHITSADYAFEASGATVQELFHSAADALLKLMIEDLEDLGGNTERVVQLETERPDSQEAIADLLHRFLEELVYFKDAQRLFLRPVSIEITGEGGKLLLDAVLRGAKIDPLRQELGTDVKGVTYHQYRVERGDRDWKATIVVDT